MKTNEEVNKALALFCGHEWCALTPDVCDSILPQPECGERRCSFDTNYTGSFDLLRTEVLERLTDEQWEKVTLGIAGSQDVDGVPAGAGDFIVRRDIGPWDQARIGMVIALTMKPAVLARIVVDVLEPTPKGG